MNENSLSSEKYTWSSMSAFDQMARQAVFLQLGKISKGCLVLEEQGERRHFGEKPGSTDLQAFIRVRDPRAYRIFLGNAELGAGEAYLDAAWDSPDPVSVIRLFARNLSILQSLNASRSWWRKMAARLYQKLRGNSRKGARKNISAHYDLSNDFFTLFLDPSMAYSSAIFASKEDSLEQASVNKFRRICDSLQLKKEDHLLEIGTGWGGLAIFAARHYGCRVTTTTLSEQQYLYARKWVEQEGLQDRIEVLHRDYRELEGKYDKLVSIEMIEAVGAEYYPEYFRRCSHLLKDDGLMLIQAITISDQRYERSVRSLDFIKRYIFPGGQLPSNAVIAAQLAEHTDMQMIDLHDITHDYALTLMHWRQRFWQRIAEVRKQGFDERFIRMWDYYLCFCEGGFRERIIHTAQFTFAKPSYAFKRE